MLLNRLFSRLTGGLQQKKANRASFIIQIIRLSSLRPEDYQKTRNLLFRFVCILYYLLGEKIRLKCGNSFLMMFGNISLKYIHL